MLFNTTHTNDAFVKESENIVGKSFSFLEKIKMRGIGSSRFMIEELSQKLQPKNLQDLAINYANIELRPKGIIIHFTNRLDRYSWIIPYYRLVTYSTKTYTIHANGHFIKFKKNKNYIDNKKFTDKMINLKISFLKLDYYDA
ncbi:MULTISPECIES: hypothetical protein [unclassified Algibacter]|uniref:hypothetical protein n=1 Tax=unclassified Algibacter TaxID=2615009 RepID=UPI00131B0E64|nr:MULTISPECIES: hypothetical protein [unclassified Algibacter]MCL5129391.1 hypothetical protein [Algibacter sp. L4_22]